ncbi:MAG: hypothetical protein HYY36_06760 [Gammaproteobacteria bacterium]|nr:hypothetical protein [Gammaproteobacteria bacterium]
MNPMSHPVEKSPSDGQFTLVSVKRTDPPKGCKVKEWYSYVIERGISTIVGGRAGTLTQVTSYATEFTADLNERMRNGGRPIWSPRSRVKK